MLNGNTVDNYRKLSQYEVTGTAAKITDILIPRAEFHTGENLIYVTTAKGTIGKKIQLN